MLFEWTEQANNFVAAQGKVFLNACPGSGKTTAVAYKLSKLVNNWGSNHDSFAGIACLSFTNIAKDEINQKYREFSQAPLRYPHLISTIDSFINLHITLPHYHLFGYRAKRPIILDNKDYLDDWNGRWNNQFKMKDNKNICFSYAPSTIELELDGSYSFNGAKPDQNKVEITLFNKYCRALKEWQMQEGLLKTTDSAFMALSLLTTYPRIAEYLARRFPVIIVDEAQDTSEIQFAILNRLADSGLKSIELVGDPYQCLYQWRNARPDLLIERTQDVSQNWNTLPLNRSRRSTLAIINCFSILRQKSDPKIDTSIALSVEKPILILKYSSGNEIEAVNKYLVHSKEFENNQIVVRGATMRDKLLGRNVSSLVFWKSPIASQVITAKLEFNRNLVRKAVNRIRSLIPIILDPKMSYVQSKEQIEQLRDNYEISAWIIQNLRALPSLGLALVDWTSQTEHILSRSLSQLFNKTVKIDFELKADGRTKKIYSQIISELIGSNPNVETNISTIHQVKGMTFDSLLLILSGNSLGQNISIKDIFEPIEFPNEKQRLIYVAMSRPRYLLAVGIPDTVSEDDLHQKFGDGIVVE